MIVTIEALIVYWTRSVIQCTSHIFRDDFSLSGLGIGEQTGLGGPNRRRPPRRPRRFHHNLARHCETARSEVGRTDGGETAETSG